MGKKRDLDRLGHFLLKFAVVEIKDNVDTSGNKKRVQLDVMDTLQLIATIMQKAESAAKFEFSSEDADTMTVQQVCDNMDIVCGDCEENIDSNLKKDIQKVAEELAKKHGLKGAAVHEIKISSEQGKQLAEMLSKLSEGKK